MIFIDALACLVMLAAAAWAVLHRGLASAVLLSGAVSLIAAYLTLRMGAVEVAIAEALIGAGLTTVIALAAVRRTQEVEE